MEGNKRYGKKFSVFLTVAFVGLLFFGLLGRKCNDETVYATPYKSGY